MTAIKDYPLTWPDTLQRSKPGSSQFRTTLAAALKNVETSLKAFARDSGKPVTNIVLSSNVGGLSGRELSDPGFAAWFVWDGEQRCIAVDRYSKPQDNLQAIHHIIEARRTEMRHGGLHIVRQTFKGFTLLPAPEAWHAVLGVNPHASAGTVEATFRQLAKSAHPDRGGQRGRDAAPDPRKGHRTGGDRCD